MIFYIERRILVLAVLSFLLVGCVNSEKTEEVKESQETKGIVVPEKNPEPEVFDVELPTYAGAQPIDFSHVKLSNRVNQATEVDGGDLVFSYIADDPSNVGAGSYSHWIQGYDLAAPYTIRVWVESFDPHFRFSITGSSVYPAIMTGAQLQAALDLNGGHYFEIAGDTLNGAWFGFDISALLPAADGFTYSGGNPLPTETIRISKVEVFTAGNAEL